VRRARRCHGTRAAFLAALQAATVFTISGDEIELRDETGALQVRATAQPATPEGASALAGTIWEVVNYNNGQQAVVSLLADTKITMTFDEDGHMSGTAGCNNYSGGYTVDGDTISIGPLVSTMMMCVAPEGVMEQEAAFLAALQAATTFTIGGDSLEMRDAGDALQIVANAQSAAAEATEAEAAIGVPLEGTPWVLTSYINAENQTLEPIEGTQATAIFMDGRVGGNASCNNYGAAYALDGNSLQIGVAVTTMMLCQPEEVAEQELAYLAALSTVASYQIEGQTLALADADGQVVLTYGVPQQTPLTGTDWQVSLYNNGKEAMVSSLAGTTITLMFVEGGNVTGNGGCNNYTGDYTLDGNQLTIGELATTRMFCAEPEGAMDQETAFLAALQSSTSFQIMGGDLELLDADGARTVTAYAQPATLAAGGNPEDVTGRTWLWKNTKYSDQTAAQPEDSTAYTLELLPDGSALVRADCNSLAGSYTMAEDGGLTLDLPSEGLSNCGEASLATAYLSDLKKAAVFSLADGALYLELDADAGSIEFVEAGAAVAAPAGEGAAMPAEEATITGQVWAWQSLDMSDGTVTTVENPEQYTIEFLEDGTLNLQADCNTGGGAYTTENGGLTIEAAVLTRMACPPGSLSDEYVARLNEVASYVMDGGLLYLNLKIDSGNMVFAPLAVAEERQPEPTPAPAAEAPAPAATGSAAAIVGPTWQWTGFQDEAERYAISQPSRYSITFQADGKYQIVADCNTGSGTYTVEGKSVRVSPAALTRKACGPDSQDSAFLTNLSAAEMVFVAGNSMYVSTSSGGTMKFTKAK
jgi:heat shock protein HslJ